MSKHKKTQAVTALLTLLSFASAPTSSVVQAEAPSAAEATATPTEGTRPTPILPSTSPAAPLQDDPRETYVLLAVLCFNEASGNELDCKAIGNIRLRYAHSRGITLREALLRLHTERRETRRESAALRTYRATQPHPEDPRPWLGDVRADLHQPLGWTGTASEWRRTARAFERLFFIAQGVETGAIRDTCEGTPIGWAGPRVDAERLARLHQQGRELVFCHGTANVYYRRAPVRRPLNPAIIGD